MKRSARVLALATWQPCHSQPDRPGHTPAQDGRAIASVLRTWDRWSPGRTTSHRIALRVVVFYGTATPRHRGRKVVPSGSRLRSSRAHEYAYRTAEECNTGVARAFELVRCLPRSVHRRRGYLLPRETVFSRRRDRRPVEHDASSIVGRLYPGGRLSPEVDCPHGGRLYPHGVNGGSDCTREIDCNAVIGRTDGEIESVDEGRPLYRLGRSGDACIIMGRNGMLTEATFFAHSDCTSISIGIEPSDPA